MNFFQLFQHYYILGSIQNPSDTLQTPPRHSPDTPQTPQNSVFLMGLSWLPGVELRNWKKENCSESLSLSSDTIQTVFDTARHLPDTPRHSPDTPKFSIFDGSNLGGIKKLEQRKLVRIPQIPSRLSGPDNSQTPHRHPPETPEDTQIQYFYSPKLFSELC